MYLPYHYRRLLNYLFTCIRGKVMLNDIAKGLGLSLALTSKYINYLHKVGFVFSPEILYVALGLERVFIISRKKEITHPSIKSLIKSFAILLFPTSFYLHSLYLIEPLPLNDISSENKVILISIVLVLDQI